MTDLVPRATVESLVNQRNHTLTLYAEAHDALSRASTALQKAASAAAEAFHGRNGYNHHLDETRKKFVGALKIPERTDYLDTARRIVDSDVWSHIVTITDLERLMDKKAKDELRQQLIQDPPEVTVDNVRATLETFAGEADMIFRRGIAECFSNLDRRFRSHDGWKIGGRVILNGAFDGWGHWNYYRNHRDTLTDIERTFLVLDGKAPPPGYGGIVGAIEEARRNGNLRPRQTEVENEYFLVRIYKNGNCHIWFKRDDLLRRVNRLLGEYYGEVIPEERAPDPDTGLNEPKTSLARNYGFFPTPEPVADELIEKCPLYSDPGEPPLTVLEPSAGTGNLASRITGKGAIVDCVEIHAGRAAELRASGRYRHVTNCDFLALKPDPAALYDRVIMNPPFDRERDIDHVVHALKFLKPDGFIAAIMSAGTEFRSTRKAAAFRELMAKMKASWRDLPPGSFGSVGTNCNTVIVRAWKNGRAVYV